MTVDVPDHELILGANTAASADAVTVTDSTYGAPISTGLTETVTTSTGTTVGSATVIDDVDSGGVYGTIPESIDSSALANGDLVSVYDDGTLLYQYTVDSNSPVDEAPTVVSGTSPVEIDSGFQPFDEEPIYINYTDDTLTFDAPPLS